MTAARPQRRVLVDAVDLDGEIVGFDGYEVHHLAGPAAAVWRLADGTLSVEQIAAVLAEGYRLDLAEARRRTRDVIRELRQRGVVI